MFLRLPYNNNEKNVNHGSQEGYTDVTLYMTDALQHWSVHLVSQSFLSGNMQE